MPEKTTVIGLGPVPKHLVEAELGPGVDFVEEPGSEDLAKAEGAIVRAAIKVGSEELDSMPNLKVIEAKKFLLAHLGEESTHADVHDALAANRVVYAGERAIDTESWQTVEQVTGTSASTRSTADSVRKETVDA